MSRGQRADRAQGGLQSKREEPRTVLVKQREERTITMSERG